MAINGSNILLLVDGQAVAEQRSYSQEKSRDMIETTVKADDAKTYEYGEIDNTVTVEGLYAPSDAAYAALEDAADNATEITIRRQREGTDIEEATALVDSLSLEAPRNDNSTFSADLQITGAWSTV